MDRAGDDWGLAAWLTRLAAQVIMYREWKIFNSERVR
jgi:hypothetical protein